MEVVKVVEWEDEIDVDVVVVIKKMRKKIYEGGRTRSS